MDIDNAPSATRAIPPIGPLQRLAHRLEYLLRPDQGWFTRLTGPGGAAVVTSVLLVVLLTLGSRIGWLPWSPECDTNSACFPGPGESLASEMVGRNYVVDGARFWFVQRDSALADENSLLLYTHNMSLGAFLFYASEMVILPFRQAGLLTDIASRCRL